MILRLKFDNSKFGAMAKVTEVLHECKAEIVTIDIVERFKNGSVRDINVHIQDPDHGDRIVKAIKGLSVVEMISAYDRTFLMHQGGKINIQNRVAIKNGEDLSIVYTPGVARVCTAIHDEPEKVFDFTIKQNSVAVVTDGTAVLGLGDIGPEAGLPVMEGKAMLFKNFANIDAWPICLDTKDPEEIIRIVKAIAPGFGGINLEDISAPRCFEIERRLVEELDIPVFHDDQHGTAVVTAAAFINALKLTGKKAEDMKVVVSGVGAAGTACTNMLMHLGVQNIIGCDRQGALYQGRDGMNEEKQIYAECTNPDGEKGSIHDVIKGADLFLGLSSPGLLTVEDLKNMNPDPIVFALANPIPEIMPEMACDHVAVMATGRSDYPNQINNVLCFPGIFRGALDCRATTINEEMKIAAAYAIANSIDPDDLIADAIVPSVFNKQVPMRVAKAVCKAAVQTGVARVK